MKANISKPRLSFTEAKKLDYCLKAVTLQTRLFPCVWGYLSNIQTGVIFHYVLLKNSEMIWNEIMDKIQI